MIFMGGLPGGFTTRRNKENNPHLSASRHSLVIPSDSSRVLPGQLRGYLAQNACKAIQGAVSAVFTGTLIRNGSSPFHSVLQNPALPSLFPAGRLSREFASSG
jgi:hypothetical protein